MFHKVMFSTRDQVMLHGSFFQLPQAFAHVLCLHMMPADRHSWKTFQEALGALGISSLAIDLRGHGESVHHGGYILDYRRFSDAEHLSSEEDVHASIDWLLRRGVEKKRFGVIGASIGANFALRALAQFELGSGVLLSPGDDYHGVKTYDAAQRLSSDQHLLVAASDPDDAESFDASKHLVEMASCKDKQFHPFVSSGHGTNLFLSHPEFMEEVAQWFQQTLTR